MEKLEQKDNKYYTPTIEEFHVGFECEMKNSSDEPFEWEPFKIIGVDDGIMGKNALMDWSFYDTRNAIEDKSIRVKYLDKEDIESLGWENIEDRGMSENYGYSFQKPIEYFSGGVAYYRLRYWFTTHRVRIEPLGGPIFDGTIKNKSELKVLLKQLGINGEKR